MRIFYQNRGKYQGEHTLYESRKEFQKHMPGINWHKWGREEVDTIQTGDWVESTDGYIVQCLMTKPLKFRTVIHRFPMGTFYTYVKKDGALKWVRFYAQFTMPGLNRVGGGCNPVDMSKKTKFGTLIAAGVPPVEAYVQAGFPYIPSTNLLKSKITRLLLDKDVSLMIKDKYQTYMDKIQKEEAFSDENMVKYIKEFMASVRKGSMVHLQSIIPLLELTGKIEPKEPRRSQKEIKAIQEAEFNEAPPSA